MELFKDIRGHGFVGGDVTGGRIWGLKNPCLSQLAFSSSCTLMIKVQALSYCSNNVSACHFAHSNDGLRL